MKGEDARATIIDGKLLSFNSALVVELALAAGGAEFARKAVGRFADRRGAGAIFEPYLNALPRHADSGGDNFARALRIVRLIGNAAGGEAYRRDYDGEWDALIGEFMGGLASEQEPKRGADGTLEDLFRECGKHSYLVMANAILNSFKNGATGEEAARIAAIMTDAFTGGMEEALT